MGLCCTDLKIANARMPELTPLNVRALANTGALHLCIPQHVALQIQLSELEKREVTLADGSKHTLPYVGPIHLALGNRSGFMGAMVLGDEVLLGAISMEDLDLKHVAEKCERFSALNMRQSKKVVHPDSRTVPVNPLNPNLPASVAKGIKAHHVTSIGHE